MRFRDTRSCVLALRTLRVAIPALPLQDVKDGPHVRRFLANEFLKAAIISLHEPYFVDAQRDLAGIIAQILVVAGPASEGEEDVPRTVILSLPGMKDRQDKVDHVLSKLRRGSTPGGQASDRQMRSMVLDLLKEVRGLSIQEMGRIIPDKAPGGSNPERGAKKQRSKMQEQYMTIDERASAGGIGGGGEEGLAGVADVFE